MILENIMSRFYRAVSKNFAAFIALVLLLSTWEIASQTGVISRLIFPPPSEILRYFFESLFEKEFFSAVGITISRLLVGFFVGSIHALLFGWTMTISTRFKNLMEPFIAAIYPIPKLAIFPLIMFIFGIGDISKVVAVAITVFFPILINTIAGVQQINPVFLQVASNYGANRWKTFTTVILPGSLPWILTGARIAINTSFMVVIAVELLSARTGLGVMIWFGWETLNTLKLYTALITISLIGILINAIFNLLFIKITPWHHTFTRQDGE